MIYSNKTRCISILIAIFIVLISCTTNNESENQLKEDYNWLSWKERELGDLLEKNKASLVISQLQVIENETKYKDLDSQYYLDQALQELKTDIVNVEITRNYPKALGAYRSLQRFNHISEDFIWTESSLKVSYIMDLVDHNKQGTVSAYLSSDYIDYENFSDKQLKTLLDFLTKGENRTLVMALLDEIGQRNLDIPQSTLLFLKSKVNIEDLIKGTVTMWVDRGMKIERGVGYPDRVIGSGFFIDKSGYLLTNYHVISSEVDPEYKGYSRLFVMLSDQRGEKIPAKVVGWSKEFDLALIKTEVDAPYVFSFAKRSAFSLGQKIFAIGSPGGLNNTVTSGTVSAINRPLQTMGEAIQIDVPINPGNSGGPLLNQNSEVKGVVFAGIDGFEGVNFAIDGAYVKNFLPRFYKGGALSYPWLGIAGYEGPKGVEVVYIQPNSPASFIGFKSGDRILKINGVAIQRVQQARNEILKGEIGELSTITWQRDSKITTSYISQENRPVKPLEEAVTQDTKEDLMPLLFGMALEPIEKNLYRITKVYTGSSADNASLSKGDIIQLKKWYVNKEKGYILIQFLFKGVKGGYLPNAMQLGTGLESGVFF